MPSVHCRTCKKMMSVAMQSVGLQAVEPENEKPVLHVRYCAIAAGLLLTHLMF